MTDKELRQVKINAAAEQGADIVWEMICNDEEGDVQSLEIACNKRTAAKLLSILARLRFFQEKMIGGFLCAMSSLEAIGALQSEEAQEINSNLIEAFDAFKKVKEARELEIQNILSK
jgi:hypothetical protein